MKATGNISCWTGNESRPLLLQKLNNRIRPFLNLQALRNCHRLDSGNSLFGNPLDLIAFFLGPHGCTELWQSALVLARETRTLAAAVPLDLEPGETGTAKLLVHDVRKYRTAKGGTIILEHLAFASRTWPQPRTPQVTNRESSTSKRRLAPNPHLSVLVKEDRGWPSSHL